VCRPARISNPSDRIASTIASGEGPSVTAAEEDGSIGADRVEDGAEIIGPHVEVGGSLPSDLTARSRACRIGSRERTRRVARETACPRGLELDLELPAHPHEVHEIDQSIA
jgi:hypothetical protein